MKKILLFLIIVCSLTMVKAEVKGYGTKTNYNYEDTKKIIKEVMKQYYLREGKIQYHASRESNYLSPEDVTIQDQQFMVCGAFSYNSLREAFGMDQNLSKTGRNLPKGGGLLTKAQDFYKENIVKGNGKNGNYLLYYENKKYVNSNNKTEHAKYVYNNIETISDLVKILQPGDVILYKSANTSGHVVVIYDLVQNDKGEIVNALYLNSGGNVAIKTRFKSPRTPLYHIRLFGEKNVSTNGTALIRAKNELVNVDVEGTVSYGYLIGGAISSHLSSKGNIACQEDECAIVRPYYNKDGKAVFNFNIDTEDYERSLLRTKYPGMVIEKTVDKLDNNSVYPGDTLEYTIKITNKSAASNSYNSSTKDYKSDATKYGKFIVQETIDTTLVELIEKNNGCIESSPDKNSKIAITCTVSGLESGKTKTIKYKVKVKDDSDDSTVIDKTIVAIGKVYKDPSSAYITTGTVKNKIIPELKNGPKVSYSKCYDDNKNKYQGRELINEIYKCAWDNKYNLELNNVFFTNIFKKPITYYDNGNPKKMDVKFNTDDAMREDSKKIVSMILNDYWNVVVERYNYNGMAATLAPYSWPYMDNRKLLVNEGDFKNGDVLVYSYDNKICNSVTCNNTNHTKEYGYYAYIYLNGKFVGVNYPGTSRERNEFTYHYFDKYDKSLTPEESYKKYLYEGYGYQNELIKYCNNKENKSYCNDDTKALLNIDNVLKRANYETLLDKDYYVILRPEIVIAKEQAKVKPTATATTKPKPTATVPPTAKTNPTATAKSSTTRPTIEPTKEPIITNSPTPTSSTSTRTKTYYRGDVNGDGEITVKDYILIIKHLINIQKLTGDELKRADVKIDGKVDPADCNQLSRIFINKVQPTTIELSS